MVEMSGQASPGTSVDSLLDTGVNSQSALHGDSVAQARALWSKADTYYFRNVARIQRLWQVDFQFAPAIC